MRMAYDVEKDRCIFYRAYSEPLDTVLKIPAGIDGEIKIYFHCAQGERCRVEFDHVGHNYVIDLNKE